jgi:fluoride ion exporter CrcB/FEX
MITTNLRVAVGGALGSITRFWLGHAVATASLPAPE